MRMIVWLLRNVFTTQKVIYNQNNLGFYASLNVSLFYWANSALCLFLIFLIFIQSYTHSLPIRNGVKSWWVRFLYFPDFWTDFVSYFPNFLWSPFLNFFVYFFQKAQVHLYNKKNLNILTHYNNGIVCFECIF